MTIKKSFILYTDTLDVLDVLTDEQAGQLLRAIRSYHCNSDEDLAQDIKIAFSPFKNQFDRDHDKYLNVCEKNKINGSKGGRPPKNQDNPVGLLETHHNPNNLDSDSDSDSDSDKTKSLIVNTKGVNVCQYQRIIDLYHEKLPNNPHVVQLSANRKTQIKARWNNGLPDMEAWGEYFDYVKASAFLTGKVQPTNGRKVFVANIDFLIKEGNVLKVFEGNYDD